MMRNLLVFAALMLPAPAVVAQEASWAARCRHELNKGNNDPETGVYIYYTRGKETGAAMRAVLDFTAKGSGAAAVYPTAAKDLMNPYGGASVGVGYFMAGDGKSAPTVGQVSMRAIAKDFKPIPGASSQMKLVIDGKPFGPYAPKESANSDGMYSVWLDTADTDGDSKPPSLKPQEFAVLAKAVGSMKSVEVVFVQDGVDIVRMPVPLDKHGAWRDGLAPWTAAHAPTDGVTVKCGGDETRID